MDADGDSVPQRRERAPWEDVFRTGPDTLAGRYLRQFWQPIWMASLLARGWSKPIKDTIREPALNTPIKFETTLDEEQYVAAE